VGQEVVFFQQMLHISDTILTYSYRFSAEVIIGAQNFNFAPKFVTQMGTLATSFAFWDELTLSPTTPLAYLHSCLL